jgi:hypothetical protein
MKKKQKTPVQLLADLAGPEYWAYLRKEAEGNPGKLMQVDAQIVANEMYRLREIEGYMLDVLEKHGISRDDPNRWLLLAFQLAQDSGAFARGRGARKKWTDDRYARLIAGIFVCQNDIAKEKRCAWESVKVIDAIRRLIKDNPSMWVTRKGGKVTPHSLQNRYNEACRHPGANKLLRDVIER